MRQRIAFNAAWACLSGSGLGDVKLSIPITVSEYSKQEIVRAFGISPEKITVTYEAAEPLVHAAIPEAVQQHHRALQPYLLYVGNAYPHKNIEGLLKAFATLRRRSREPLRLVLVGKMDYFYTRLQAMANNLQLADGVVFPGYVTDEELASLYASR